MPPSSWPKVVIEGGFVTTSPVEAAGVLILDDPVSGLLGTGTLGSEVTWSDITAWARAGHVSRPVTREQGPLYAYQVGTCAVTLNNLDGRFDPDNLGGPYVAAGLTQLRAMVPVRVRAVWAGVTYALFQGFADSWADDGVNYASHYAEVGLTASDCQKILNGLHLDTIGAAGAGELSGARVSRILDAAAWYTGTRMRQVATGDSTMQATTLGDTAWTLLQVTADSEVGELYIAGNGAVTFRNRKALYSDTRSNTSQAVFGDDPGELPFRSVTRARDDTTIANDIQATRVGGALQEVQDGASIARYLFPRTYQRDDLILQTDADALNWAQWILYVSKDDEDRFDQLTVYPQRDPENLWPHALGREIGDRITITRRPPGVPSPVTRDCFIRGIEHDFDVSAGLWQTTFTLQDASRYGSFLVLDNALLGQLDNDALAY